MENSTYVNRRLLHVLFFVILGLSSQAQHVAKSLTAGNGSLIGFYEYKPTDYKPTGEKYPLIIFLHGVSERGNGTTDLPKVLAQGIPRYINKGHKMTFTWNGKKETFLVLSPQLSLSYGNWQQFYTEEMLKYAKSNLNIDTNRIYLTGISLGGGGVWNYASATEANSRKFAAIAPICGTCSMSNGCNIAKSNVPVWTEHAANDPTVSVNCTVNANKAINACIPGVKPIEFIPPTGGHVIWNRSYDTAYAYHQPLIYEWFLGQNKSLPINKLPVAKATAPEEVNISTGTFTLSASGSTDSDGTIVRYGWRQISGPVTTSVQSSVSVNSNVSGITTIGTYTYELTVVDNRATWHKDTVTVKGVSGAVIVPNKAPTANAGADQTITLPANSVTLNGGASTDSDGTIATWAWIKISGPASGTFSNAGAVNTGFSGLTEGTYSLQLKVTDDDGAADLDTINVIVLPVPNKAPTANAGADQTITLPANSVTLNGSASTDVDGTIATWAWTKISGPASGTFSNAGAVNTNFSGLNEGTYSLQLKVTDDDGAADLDTINVIVLPAPNKAPTANAGADQTITLPANSVTLNGGASTDSDGTIATWAWIKISGPASGTFSNAGVVNTNFSGLTEGTYQVQLKVTDEDGDSDLDTVKILVKPEPIVILPNKAPIANAGADQTITLPANSVTLNAGASTDSDGTIATWAWIKISGPASGTFSNAGVVNTNFSGLTEGTYQVQLKVTDEDGDSDLDTVKILVKPEPIVILPNKAPIANAGADQTITLPANSVTLNAGASTDSDGTIATWAWTKISGPASGTFSNAGVVNTNFSGLTEGTYLIELRITDNEGASDLDTVKILVKPEPIIILPNKAPTANAGADQTITLPANSVSLNAGASTDSDGTITTWAWTKISGPASGTFSNAGAVNSNFSGLNEGTYQVQLKVTDEDGDSDLDTVKILVKPEPIVILPNKAPIANAGADQSITLPANSVTLNGNASTDSDGTITTWAWTKISGPAAGTFSNAGAVNTSFSGLTEGTYQIQLKVTDEDGDSDLDTVKILVKPEPIVILPNKAPTANAGADQTITLPANSVSLNGNASTDVDGTIATWAWTKISGPASGTFLNAGAVNTNFSGLIEGNYLVELKITDNEGASDLDTVKILVKPEPIVILPNKAPTANAGADQTITLPANSVTLNGNASTDVDGTIATWAWTKISGPASGTFSNAGAVNTNFSGLTEGTYSLQLKVTDDDGAADLDTINVIVLPAPNKAPTANAGADQTITLPANSVSLNGGASTDSDGTIATWAWTKISGPASGTFSNAGAVNASFSGLTEGTYLVELRITDNEGASDLDTVKILVKPEPIVILPNKAPTANAGADQTITLPANSVTLKGNASTDVDGTIATWAWTKISGPASGTFSNAEAVNTNFSGLIEGTYLVELRITDNEGASDLDTVKIMVKPEPIVILPNKAPTANAGADQTITLPANSVTLNGSTSLDSDGTIATWAWTKISGPASGTFSNAGLVNTSFSGLIEGTYQVQLKVTDEDGASDLDTVKILVKPEPIVILPNKAPTANAGADQTITLPANSVSLNGGASTDADGTIANWAWTKISGPASGTFSNAGAVNASFSGLTEGTYQVQLKVTDEDGDSDLDTLKITVRPLPNKAPTANAGIDQVIFTNTESVELDGSLSKDPDGTISTYNWTRIKGTGTMTMTTPNSAVARVYGLTEGIHVFRLIVTDNLGLQSTDEVSITVNQPENQQPVAHAGQDITIYVPESKATLNAEGSKDPDGIIARYLWKQLSGPRIAIQTSPASVLNEISELAPGAYLFELTVTDNRNGVSKDTIALTVINNFRYEEKLVVSPNPAVSNINLTIYSDSNGPGVITIRDAYGRILKHIKIDKAQPVEEDYINVNDLKNGLYYIEYTIENSKRMVTRFIKH